MTQRCKCGTDALGGCRVHTAASMRLVEAERDRLREALQQTVDLCNAMREYAPTINLAAEKQLRESLRLLHG